MGHFIVQRASARLRSAIDQRLKPLYMEKMLHALEVIQPVLVAVETAAEMLPLDRSLHLLTDHKVVRVAYWIMDIVDELVEDMRRHKKNNAVDTKLEYVTYKVLKMTEPITQRRQLDMDQRAEVPSLVEACILQLDMDQRAEVPSLVEACILGRGPDKQRIVAVLLSATSNITQVPPSCIILPIFGFPGSGKTTLAQMVFNDHTHFLPEYNFRVWVHVSPELDFHRICESILCQVMSPGEEVERIRDHGSNSGVVVMESTMNRLHELLNGKKVLLVLDDLWEEDSIQLQLLKSMLTFLGDKVDVIVTTCNQAIARKICTIVQPYRLNPLGDDTCWEIIQKLIIFEEEDEELEKIGRKIASKCCGVPQEAREYASMLKHCRDQTEWGNIMERNHVSTAFLQTFILSYMSMSPELRLCYDYCCDIFPNGHNIVKDDLVHQWIALDFIEPSERSSATEIAEGYITRLLDMSFFQTAESYPAGGNDDKGAAMFTMHDLVHGVASLMWMEVDLPPMHTMLFTNCGGKLNDLDDDYLRADYLRALRCVDCSGVESDDWWFPFMWSLRVLELQGSSVPELHASIWQLRQLGYLKISAFTGLVTLPESFGNLTNLLHIDLSGSSGLTKLPESFGQLISLVHVNLSGCSRLTTLPGSVGRLIKLSHINLSGCCRLVTLPESFGMLISLVHVNLSGCSGLVTLPGSVGMLIKLSHINLSGCSRLVTLSESFGKLIHLEHANLSGCFGLVGLPESFGKLMSLVHVNLSGCSRLVTLPEFGKLISLVHISLLGCSRLATLPGSIVRLINLSHINLSGCSRLLTLSESFGKLILLVHVNLSGCSGLVSLPESFGKLVNLVHLNLSGCTELATLPESFEDLVNLSHLNLSHCHRLAQILEALHKHDKLVYLDLSFWSCFEGIGKCLGRLTNLEHLNLSNPSCYLAQHRSHLQGLKDGLCKLTRLLYLNLSMCLNPIFYYHKSQEESLQYIESCVSSLSSLEHLDLSHNTFLADLPQSLGDLNKLHTLNLSGCIRLKKLGEMKSLRFIALRNCRGLKSCSFVVCVDDYAPYSSSNIVQLEDVNCQELQISCLEKVGSTKEAQRIRLVEKQKLEKLKLSWTLGSIRSVKDTALLRELIPPSNLHCLEINGYAGTCLPEYLGDHTSLQELKIVCCKQLKSLPDSIQKLTNLKNLCIFHCPEVEKWCALEENKRMLAHIPNKNYEDQGSASRTKNEDDSRSINDVEEA